MLSHAYGKIACDGQRGILKVIESETLLAGHEDPNGYWYIGNGRSIAEGPYRTPQQLLDVASELLAGEAHWRVEVFDVSGAKVLSRSNDRPAG
jgi:hypothetical protein